MKVLITAFEAFGNSHISSSKEVLNSFLDRDNIFLATLPVSYHRAESMIEELIKLYKPDLLLMLGQAGADKQVRVENIAINRRDVNLADTDGYIAKEELIDNSEPLALFAPSDVCELRDAIKAEGILSKRSNSAGLFVCNATFFRALIMQKNHYPNMNVVFLHYPVLPEQSIDYPERYTISLYDMVKSAEIVIDYYRKKTK